MDDDSDEEDDKPKKAEPEAPPKKEEVDLLDINASEPPKDLLSDLYGPQGGQQNNLLDMGQANPSQSTTNILDMNQPASQDLLQTTPSQPPATEFGFMQQPTSQQQPSQQAQPAF